MKSRLSEEWQKLCRSKVTDIPTKKEKKTLNHWRKKPGGKKIKFLSFLSDTLQTLKHKCVGSTIACSTLWIFLCRKCIILKYVCVGGWVCEWVPKHTQSTVKYFLGYLPPRAGQRWMGELKRWERVLKKRAEKAEESSGSNKVEGVQLADSGQSTRTPTTEWVQEEREAELKRERGGEVRGGSGGGYSEAQRGETGRKFLQVFQFWGWK